MVEQVKLGEVEMPTNAEIDEDGLVSMEILQCSVKLDQCFGCVCRVLCNVQKVKNCTYSMDQVHRREAIMERKSNDKT